MNSFPHSRTLHSTVKTCRLCRKYDYLGPAAEFDRRKFRKPPLYPSPGSDPREKVSKYLSRVFSIILFNARLRVNFVPHGESSLLSLWEEAMDDFNHFILAGKNEATRKAITDFLDSVPVTWRQATMWGPWNLYVRGMGDCYGDPSTSPQGTPEKITMPDRDYSTGITSLPQDKHSKVNALIDIYNADRTVANLSNRELASRFHTSLRTVTDFRKWLKSQM